MARVGNKTAKRRTHTSLALITLKGRGRCTTFTHTCELPPLLCSSISACSLILSQPCLPQRLLICCHSHLMKIQPVVSMLYVCMCVKYSPSITLALAVVCASVCQGGDILGCQQGVNERGSPVDEGSERWKRKAAGRRKRNEGLVITWCSFYLFASISLPSPPSSASRTSHLVQFAVIIKVKLIYIQLFSYVI